MAQSEGTAHDDEKDVVGGHSTHSDQSVNEAAGSHIFAYKEAE